jgi:polyhydroxybutyrate depolymerase
MRSFALTSLALLTLACTGGPAETTASGGAGGTGSASSGATGGTGGTGGEAPTIFGGDRPVTLVVPSSVKPGVPAPLVLLLHGYSVDGTVQELYFQLAPLAQSRGFYYAHPNGTVDEGGKYFWNATDACCNFYGSDVDDSAYLASLIDEIQAAYDVDPKRIYLVGHSNGGFMSYRMACDHADKIAAIASLAGATYLDPADCNPSGPVSVLQIHGTEDSSVPYDGSSDHPSAEGSASAWAAIDGCSPTPDTSAPAQDFEPDIDGAETLVKRWNAGCQGTSGAELWTIQGGSHLPGMNADFRNSLIDFLYAHPKP